jgi:hypothetical protein
MSSDSNDMVNAIKNAIWHEIDNNLHTAIPAIVSTYDHTGPTIEAQIAIKKLFDDDDLLSYRPIVEVPVVFPRTNRFRLTFPLEKGDTVLLLFSESALEKWLGLKGDAAKKEIDPGEVRKFDITDAIAIPGLFPDKQGSKIDNKNNVEIAFDNVKIMTDGSKVNVTAGGVVTALSGVVTGESLCAFTGLPHPDASDKMFVEK